MLEVQEIEAKIYLSQDEAANLLGISRMTLWRWIQAGDIEPSGYVAGKVRRNGKVFNAPFFERKSLLTQAETRKFIKSYKKDREATMSALKPEKPATINIFDAARDS